MGTWSNNAYKTISITDGTDTTNPDLIAWLEANATQVTSTNNYDLSYNLTNLTNGNVSLTFVADTGYALPSSITVSNGTLVSWNQSTGVAVISGYSNNTSVSVECVVAASGYSVSVSAEKLSGNLTEDFATAIKFNTAPTSENDYDIMVDRFGTITGSTTFTGKAKIYAWVPSSVLYGGISVNGSGTDMNRATNSYTTPLEITLSTNSNVVLDYFTLEKPYY